MQIVGTQTLTGRALTAALCSAESCSGNCMVLVPRASHHGEPLLLYGMCSILPQGEQARGVSDSRVPYLCHTLLYTRTWLL